MSAGLDYTSLEITLRGLLEECDNDAVLASLDRKLATGIMDDKHRALYRAALDELRAIPPTAPTHPILLSVWWNDGTGPQDDVIDVGLWNPGYVPPPEGLTPKYGLRGKPAPAGRYDAEADIHHQHFGMGLTPWSEVIDATIWIDHARVMELCPTLADVLAEVVWELTFYGLSSAAVSETRAEIVASVVEYKRGVADGAITDVDPLV